MGPRGKRMPLRRFFAGFCFLRLCLRREAFAVHFQDMDVVGQAVQQRPRQAF